MAHKKHITIIGAGMAGSLMALLLANDGYTVDILESQQDITKQPDKSYRSINQSLAVKGITALKRAGIWEDVQKIALPQRGRVIHQSSGISLYEPYGTKDDCIEWTVNRNELNKLLLRKLRAYRNVTVMYRVNVTSYDPVSGELGLVVGDEGRQLRKRPSVVIGADGINSYLRGALDRANGITSSVEAMLWGYKNILIQEEWSKDGRLPFRNDAFHCWPRLRTGSSAGLGRRSSMVGMANHGFFTGTLILPLHGPESFDSLKTKSSVVSYFKDQYEDLAVYAERFVEAFIAAKPTVFRTVRSPKWYYKDRAVLIGDAAHAFTVFMGQGINAAFDDCVLLADLMHQHSTDFEAAFQQFQLRRQPNTNAMADISLERLTELKDKYSSPFYLARTATERLLERSLPKIWRSRYSLVVHSDIPYAEAAEKYKRQWSIARLFGVDVFVAVYGILLSFQQSKQRMRGNSQRVNGSLKPLAIDSETAID